MNFKDFSMAVLVTAIWGLNFSVIKLGLTALDPFTLAAVRFLLCALPFVFFVPKPDITLPTVALYGVLFGIGIWGMVNLGIYFGVSAGIASLVLQTSVFFSIALSVLLLKETVQAFKWIGFVCALLGLLVILNLTDGSMTNSGIALVIVGAVAWSITNVLIKKTGVRKMFSLMVWSSVFSPLPLFLLAYLTQGSTPFAQFFDVLDSTAIFSILFQVYPTTLFGYCVWNNLLKKYDVSKVAPLTLLVPVFGLLGSYFIFAEPMSSAKLLASGLIISGLLINTFGHHFFERGVK